MRKPEKEIYLLTVERLGDGLRPEDCVFVDDIEVNCDVARELGMTAVHFRSNDQAIAEIEGELGRAAASAAR
jgi:FMN phosphatase YigB (HAD superfamily)